MNAESSDIWDKRFNLPLVKGSSNPHLFCAYFKKLGIQFDPLDYVHFLTRCEKGRIIMRFPDGGAGATSHDEIIGISCLYPSISKNILNTATDNFGRYDSEFPDNPRWKTFLPRFVSTWAYLKSGAGEGLGLWGPLWSVDCVLDALSEDGMSGHLMFWLMKDRMRNHLMCKPAIMFWEHSMRKRGFTELKMFSEYFPQIPEIKELCKDVLS